MGWGLGRGVVSRTYMSIVFLVVEPSKITFLIQNTITKRRIYSYSILGTIVSPNKKDHMRNLGPIGFRKLCRVPCESVISRVRLPNPVSTCQLIAT